MAAATVSRRGLGDELRYPGRRIAVSDPTAATRRVDAGMCDCWNEPGPNPVTYLSMKRTSDQILFRTQRYCAEPRSCQSVVSLPGSKPATFFHSTWNGVGVSSAKVC
jgi:hypothetical protein